MDVPVRPRFLSCRLTVRDLLPDVTRIWSDRTRRGTAASYRRYRLIAAYTDVAGTAEKLMELILRSGLLQMGIIGALVVAYFCKDDRYKLKIIGAWVGTLFVFSVIIPIIEHDWAHRNDRLPFEYDLIRNFRYFFAISLMLAFWPIAVARQNAKQPRTQMYIGAVGVILVAYSCAAIRCVRPSIQPLISHISRVRPKSPKSTNK